MPLKEGQVSYCGYKNVNVTKGKNAGKTVQAWSFRLEGDNKFYNCGFTKPARADGIKLLPGDLVKFSYEDGNFGAEVDMKSLKSKIVTQATSEPDDGPAPAPQKRSFGGGGQKSGGGGARDDYWQNKDAFDKNTTQPLILRQSANNVAAQLVCAALEKDVLPLPAKKGDKWDALMLCFNQVSDELYANSIATYHKLGGPDVSGILGLSNVGEEGADDRSAGELSEMSNVDSGDAADDGWSEADDGW